MQTTHLGWTISDTGVNYVATFDKYYSGESEYQINANSIEEIKKAICNWFLEHDDSYMSDAWEAISAESREYELTFKSIAA
jgi:hypothetical protein